MCSMCEVTVWEEEKETLVREVTCCGRAGRGRGDSPTWAHVIALCVDHTGQALTDVLTFAPHYCRYL